MELVTKCLDPNEYFCSVVDHLLQQEPQRSFNYARKFPLTPYSVDQWIAETLLAINERGTWTQDINSLAKDPEALTKQDYEAFNYHIIHNLLPTLFAIDIQHRSSDQLPHLC